MSSLGGVKPQSPSMSREEASILIRRLVDLPTLPVVLSRLIEVVEDDRSSAQDLAQVIMTDQSLTSRILKLANSAFYGQLRRVSSVTQAVVLLGFDLIKSLALGISVFDALWGKGAKTSIERERLWRHSLTAAIGSTIVAASGKVRERETAFVAGLLHDIGRVALYRVFPDRYHVVCELAAMEGCPLHEVEAAMLGFDHAEVGGWLSDQWKLPPSLVEAIAFHHRPGAAPPAETLLVSIVHIGDLLAKGAEGGGEDWTLLLDPAAKAVVGLTEAEIRRSAEELSSNGKILQTLFAG